MPLTTNGSMYAQPSDLAQVGLLGTFLQIVPLPSQIQSLQTASGIMDGYLQQVFTLPLQTWGYDVQQYCCWIAAYILVQQRGYNPNNTAETTFKDRYEMAMKWLNDVTNHRATPQQVLDSSPNAQPNTPAAIASPQLSSPGLAAGVPPPATWGTWGRG